PQNLVYNKLIIPKRVRIVMEKNITEKMNVKTRYKGDLLRKGKIETVKEETAERWIGRGLAKNENKEKNNKHEYTNTNTKATNNKRQNRKLDRKQINRKKD